MRTRTTAEKISTTKRYLTVRTRVQVGATLRWVDVKVPWRLLNDRYEEVADCMAAEAADHLSQHWDVPMLPLEKWE